MLLRITASAFNERGPLYMEQVLAALHQGNRARQPVTLSFLRQGEAVTLACDVPDALCPLVLAQFLAHYPSTQIEPADDPARRTGGERRVWSAEVTLRSQVFPLKRHPQFEDAATRTSADPLTGLLSALAGHENDPLQPRIDMIIQPARTRQVRRAQKALTQLAGPRFAAHHFLTERYIRWTLSRRWRLRGLAWLLAHWAGIRKADPSKPPPSARTHDRENALQAAHDKLQRYMFEVQIRLSVQGPMQHEKRALAKLEELAGALGPFSIPNYAVWRLSSLVRHATLTSLRSEPFLLSAEELATLWHLPTFSIRAPTLDLVPYRQLEPPPVIPDPRREPESISAALFERRSQCLRDDALGEHVAE